MSASDFYIIHTRNLETGNEDYYTYDKVNNTMIRYNEDNVEPLKEQLLQYKKMIMFLGIETVAVIIVLVCILINKVRNNKKRKEKLRNENKKHEEKKKNN